MRILSLNLEVPDWITDGMNLGKFTRHADGTVRVAEGLPGAGSIVAHLKEVGAQVQECPAGPLLSAPTMILTLVTMRQEKQNEKLFLKLLDSIQDLHRELRMVGDDVRFIKNAQVAQLLSPVIAIWEASRLDSVNCSPHHGESIKRWFLETASLWEAFLGQTSGRDIAENMAFFGSMLSGIKLLYMSEQVLCANDVQVRNLREAQWLRISRLFAEQLDSVQAPTARGGFPTPAMLRIPRYFSELKRLKDQVVEFIDILTVLQQPALLDSAEKMISAVGPLPINAIRHLCLVYANPNVAEHSRVMD